MTTNLCVLVATEAAVIGPHLFMGTAQLSRRLL
jgi:hypothetical protein